MIFAHYAHRLPADYDLGIIRARAQSITAAWDAVPDLHFKAFLLREKGKHSATANGYSSLYLWKREEALRDFLTGGRFRFVTDSFGTPAVDVRLPVDARRGPAREAKIALIEEIALPLDADPTAFLAEETEQNRIRAQRPEVVATVTALDGREWRVLRAVLTESPTDVLPGGTPHQVLHLARPQIDELP